LLRGKRNGVEQKKNNIFSTVENIFFSWLLLEVDARVALVEAGRVGRK